MNKILLIGLDPDSIDFSAPSVPPGMNAEKLLAIITDVQKRFADQGDHLDNCKVKTDGSAEATVTAQLAHTTYNCILIGGGVQDPENIEVLERVVNSIHRYAPGAVIGFVNHPEDAPEGAARVLSNDLAASPDQSADRAAHVLSLMKQGDDAFNSQDIAGMNAVHHPDIIAHIPGSDKPSQGRNALAAAMQGMFRAFPNVHIENDPYPIQLGEGDWMTVVTKATGTFSGEMVLPDGKTIPGTGKSFDLTFSTTARWKGELMAEEWVSWDSALMNQQIGIS